MDQKKPLKEKSLAFEYQLIYGEYSKNFLEFLLKVSYMLTDFMSHNGHDYGGWTKFCIFIHITRKINFIYCPINI